MKHIKYLIAFFLLLAFAPDGLAYINPKAKKKGNKTNEINFREDCAFANAVIDQQVNNVRARLLAGGDVWWDGSGDAKYIVPAPKTPGDPEVSSIFTGGVWIGGLDPAGNLKIAAVTFSTAGNDWYTGPLDPVTGLTDRPICENWDRFFRVDAANIDQHNQNWDLGQASGEGIDCDLIDDQLKRWPGKGNPYWLENFDFDLPNTGQGLGAFWDEDGDGDYDPCKGDFPIIDIRGCEPLNRAEAKQLVPDEMYFWIYNDAGGVHTSTQGAAIQMEVQVQAFAYASNDELNDMTFQRYKLINRANTDIRDCYFAMYVDADLGCFEDDYIGCDVSRSLAYVYNSDDQDGSTGCNCSQGVLTYCNEVPMIGVDYFRGPLSPQKIVAEGEGTPHVIKASDGFFPPYQVGDVIHIVPSQVGEDSDIGIELGMSSFIYFNNQASGNPNPATTDPEIAEEYYNYLTGLWKDGTPITQGGSGYNPGSTDTVEYVFPDAPNLDGGWSMGQLGLEDSDRRTVQASGPFLLKPGAINELIIGVPWVPDVTGQPTQDITRMQFADDLAQSLFDNCFKIKDGPDAPDIDIVELDKELILILSNDSIISNNRFEQYQEPDLKPVPEGFDSLYRFEGYQIYQLADQNVTPQELNDIDKARLIAQVDLKNDIGTIFNWRPSEDGPTLDSEIVWDHLKVVEGENEGIRRSFRITQDDFAQGDQTSLVNHKEYHFMALAYSYNNWQEFNPYNQARNELLGQQSPYCPGRRNVKVTTGVPRPIIYTNTNVEYGESFPITRVDGIGAGNTFLDMTDDMYDKILDGSAEGRITYKEGAGPFEVKVVNPLEILDGRYQLSINGNFVEGSTCALEPGARWELVNLDNGQVVASETTIDALNEQVVADYGFSITMGQTDDVGTQANDQNGTIGQNFNYSDINGDPWLTVIPDNVFGPAFDWLQTNVGQVDEVLDPKQGFSQQAFSPFILADYRRFSDAQNVSPGWRDGAQGQGLRALTRLSDLNNVDIVFTSDKSKWSRCVVVEAASEESIAVDGSKLSEGGVNQFDLRATPSVGKEDADGDGFPDPDGDDVGMGWFPGYAVDVESGKRLNIFFGESSVYNQEAVDSGYIAIPYGTDMMFNPSSDVFLPLGGFTNTDISKQLVAGGRHFVYVTRQEYDECADFREFLAAGLPPFRKRDALKLVTWTAMPLGFEEFPMLSYADGLIPNDLTIKLRVDSPYGKEESFNTASRNSNCDAIGELPIYEFEISNRAASEVVGEDLETALDNVNVVPNPYYAYSEYENSRLDNRVKITNLPNQATVTIYTLDGKFIRQFRRDEQPMPQGDIRSNPGVNSSQTLPSLEWDLKNNRGVPVASGVYLIHIVDPNSGSERTIKWFGVTRKFDPAGL